MTVILKQRRRLDVVSILSEFKPFQLLKFFKFKLFHFGLKCNSYKQIIEIRILRFSKF